jgi:hypothetical protein
MSDRSASESGIVTENHFGEGVAARVWEKR